MVVTEYEHELCLILILLSPSHHHVWKGRDILFKQRKSKMCRNFCPYIPSTYFPFQWWADGRPFHGSRFSDNTVYEFHYVLGSLRALCLSAAIRKWKGWKLKIGNRCSLFVTMLISVWNKNCALKNGFTRLYSRLFSISPLQRRRFEFGSANTRWIKFLFTRSVADVWKEDWISHKTQNHTNSLITVLNSKSYNYRKNRLYAVRLWFVDIKLQKVLV